VYDRALTNARLRPSRLEDDEVQPAPQPPQPVHAPSDRETYAHYCLCENEIQILFRKKRRACRKGADARTIHLLDRELLAWLRTQDKLARELCFKPAPWRP
jgi:hypothetical protein